MQTITSKDNEFIKHIKKLKDKKYREISNEYVVEGIKLVEEAIQEKAPIKQIVLCDDCEKNATIPKDLMYEIAKHECIYVTEKLFNYISTVQTPQGILAILSKNGQDLPIDYTQDIIVALDDVQDPGNLGTILRTVDSIGLTQILVSKETADAYIIRNEVVLKGENYKNGIEKVKTEGKKVAKKDTVFRYYVNGEDELKKRIEEIDNKILEVQDTEIINYSGEIKNIKNQIKEILEEMSKTNNIEDLKIYKKEISECNSKIVKIIGENTKKGSYLRDLINEKEKYEKKLEDNAEIIKAKESGIISYRVDGYEDILKPNKFSNITFLCKS